MHEYMYLFLWRLFLGVANLRSNGVGIAMNTLQLFCVHIMKTSFREIFLSC